MKLASVLFISLFSFTSLSLASQTTTVGDIVSQFLDNHTEACALDNYQSLTPQYYKFTANEKDYDLYIFVCSNGVTNAQSVLYLVDDEGKSQKLSFTVPKYIDKTPAHASPQAMKTVVQNVSSAGMISKTYLINAEFDPEKLELISYNKFRGLADAFSRGTWTFEDGQFVLKKYEVDATQNMKIDPEVIYSASMGN